MRSERRRRTSERAEPTPREGRILVVEPDASLRPRFVQALEAVGYVTHAVAARGGAVDATAVERFDLVVCDVDACGSEDSLIAELHAFDPSMVFVASSDGMQLDARLRELAQGVVVGTVSRPCSEDELVHAVDRALEVHTRRSCGRPSGAPGRVRVLLVEDDPDDAMLTRRRLERAGTFDVEEAALLSDAETVLERDRFDVLLVDLSLPDGRGFDAVRRMRRAAPDAALLVLTGSSEPALHLQLVRMGAQDVLTKGLDDEAMQRAIELSLERSVYLSELVDMARHDQLTGLANRRTFLERLQMARSCTSSSSTHMGLLCIDLDRFKAINDSLGHDAGDALLVEVAARLRRAVRDEDTVARLGGDEFAVVLTRLGHPEDAEMVAARVVRSLARPVDLLGRAVVVTASVGVVVLEELAGDLDGLMRSADAAMYEAKRRGRNRVVLHAPTKEAVA